ncbi:MAG: methyltransferase [Flavobacteriales bacterium]|nr:methyltransferase [Flavobacteriales bacterium]
MRFHFKSFSIKQEQSAMKVGTDGVLLGAWTKPSSYPHQILDIGTGTGLVAIMLAQRFTRSQIHAIEIDQASAEEALFNAQSSPWSERLNISHCALQNYNPSIKYDLIVSNPPYFRNTTPSQNLARATARNNDNLSLEYLVEKSHKLLNENGELDLIIPSNEFATIQSLAEKFNFYINKLCWVRGNHQSPIKRLLIALNKNKEILEEKNLTIEKSRHNYTQDYKNLCQDFYLKL